VSAANTVPERSAPEEADDDGFGGQMTVARAREREQ
jgi:hypothetical protein